MYLSCVEPWIVVTIAYESAANAQRKTDEERKNTPQRRAQLNAVCVCGTLCGIYKYLIGAHARVARPHICMYA